MYLVVVEPVQTLFRLVRLARERGLQTLVVTRDAEQARVREDTYLANDARGVAAGAGAAGDADQVAAVPPADAPRAESFVECDVTSAEAIAAALEPFADQIAGILPGAEVYVPPAFGAGSALGLDCATAEDARCQHLKSAMKERLVAHGVRTPPFRIASSLAEAEQTWRDFGGDCMVKLVDFEASAHIYRATKHAELVAAWSAITAEERDVDTPFRARTEAVLERFVGGREVTAEGYVCGDRVAFVSNCEKVTSPRFVVVDHLVPARLSPAERAAVEEAAAACVRALGIRNTVFHVELHIEDGEPYVIECAARAPGQPMPELIRRAYGVDLHAVAVDLATGMPVEVDRPRPDRWFALLGLYAERAGRLTGVRGLDELRRRGVLGDWHLRARVGGEVTALSTFQQRYGWVQVEAPGEDELRGHVEWAQRHLRLAVDGEDGALDGPDPAAVAAATAQDGRF